VLYRCGRCIHHVTVTYSSQRRLCWLCTVGRDQASALDADGGVGKANVSAADGGWRPDESTTSFVCACLHHMLALCINISLCSLASAFSQYWQRDWLGRAYLKWPIFVSSGTLPQAINCFCLLHLSLLPCWVYLWKTLPLAFQRYFCRTNGGKLRRGRLTQVTWKMSVKLEVVIFAECSIIILPLQVIGSVLFCSSVVVNSRVGHIINILSPFISVFSHSDWLFYDEPVHFLMLSIQAVPGLPCPTCMGIVPCIISFSRQLSCFLIMYASFFALAVFNSFLL